MRNMIKFIICLTIIAALCILFYIFFYNAGLFSAQNKSFSSTDEVLYNPNMGYALPAEYTNAVGDNSLVYIDILWNELEPNEGQFNFSKIETDNQVKKWKSLGKHAVLRFIADLPTDEAHMDIPQWLYDKIGGEGVAYNYSGRFGFSPDYNNEILIAEHKKAIEALGEHFSKDTFVSFVEFGSLGHWGEWHVSYSDGVRRMPKADVREKYITPYIDSFKNAKFLMRRPFNTAKTHGFGLYNDMAGYPTDTEEWLSWIEKGGDYSQAEEKNALSPMADAWKTAPIGGEFNSTLTMDEMLKDNLQRTRELIEKSHTTFLGPKAPTGLSESSGKDCMDGAKEVLAHMGYRLRIKNASVGKIKDNNSFNVSLTWTNDGIAPMYWNWDVYLYFMDDGRNEILKVPVDMKLTDVLPGSEIKTNTKIEWNENLHNLHYLCIGIIDPLSEKPAVRFGMQAEFFDNYTVLTKYEK